MEKPKPIQWKGPKEILTPLEEEHAKIEALRVIAEKLNQLEHSVSLFVSTQIAADVPFPPRPAAIRPNHTKDEDCDVDPKTSTCRMCGVGHFGPPCVDCGKLAFHADGCPESRYEPVPLPSEDAQRLAVKSAALSDVRASLRMNSAKALQLVRKVLDARGPGLGVNKDSERDLFDVEELLSAELGQPIWEGRRS
jgi:hypothetical protein